MVWTYTNTADRDKWQLRMIWTHCVLGDRLWDNYRGSIITMAALTNATEERILLCSHRLVDSRLSCNS